MEKKLIVYQYMKEEYAELAICNKRLKGSEILRLNDPFELLPNVREKSHRDKFDDFKNIIAKEYLLFCFSKTSKSPQMWAHYANNHTGVCLGFLVRDKHHLVKYKKDRLKFDPTCNLKDEPSSLKFLDKLIKIKDINWKYEKEYRFLEKKKGLSKDGDNFFHEFKEGELELRFVTLGMNSAPHIDQKYDALLKHYGYSEKIQLNKVNKAYGTYSMTTHKHKIL